MKKSVFLLVLSVFFLLACSKEKDPAPVASEIEYRLESSTATSASEITYTNEAGGTTTLQNTPLPFSIKVKPTITPGKVFVLVAYITDPQDKPQSITGSLLVNGKVEDTETGSGVDPHVSLSYTRP